jgi:type VI secretion system secreted protein Hcp
MRFTRLFVTVLGLAAALVPSQSAKAYEFYVSINGAKQGLFHGESLKKGRENMIPGDKYDFEVVSPRDMATGQATGRRQYKPIVFRKEWGAATTQIYQALVMNEQLKEVVFDFIKTNNDGVEVVDFKVTLTNAYIVGIHQHVGDTNGDGSMDGRKFEDISLSFQSILIEHGKSSGGDGTNARAGENSTLQSARTSVAAIPAAPAVRPARRKPAARVTVVSNVVSPALRR